MNDSHDATLLIERADWRLKAWGQVEEEARWNWSEFERLPRTERVGELSCGQGWTRAGRRWTGVPTREILSRIRLKPDAAFVIVHGHGGYRANFSLYAFAVPDAILVHSCDERPLGDEQGGPVRLIVPGRESWKAVKRVCGLEFLNKDWPGTRELSEESCGP